MTWNEPMCEEPFLPNESEEDEYQRCYMCNREYTNDDEFCDECDNCKECCNCVKECDRCRNKIVVSKDMLNKWIYIDYSPFDNLRILYRAD